MNCNMNICIFPPQFHPDSQRENRFLFFLDKNTIFCKKHHYIFLYTTINHTFTTFAHPFFTFLKIFMILIDKFLCYNE